MCVQLWPLCIHVLFYMLIPPFVSVALQGDEYLSSRIDEHVYLGSKMSILSTKVPMDLEKTT